MSRPLARIAALTLAVLSPWAPTPTAAQPLSKLTRIVSPILLARADEVLR